MHIELGKIRKASFGYGGYQDCQIVFSFELGEKAYEVFQIIRDAKKKSLDELEGVPIRAYFDSPVGRIIKFEILKEVL